MMKACTRLLANPASVGSGSSLRPAPLALLPPIPLYRRLLRAQRKYMPQRERLLGEEYIKSEFRAHRNVENPMHIVCPPCFIPPRDIFWQQIRENVSANDRVSC